jgi:RNA 3'-terminal phosphate cyclase (ATP)
VFCHQIFETFQVLKPLLEKFGIKFECDIIRRGYYPKGGGEVVFKIDPIVSIKPIEINEFGNLTKIKGYSFVAGVLPIKVSNFKSIDRLECLSFID